MQLGLTVVVPTQEEVHRKSSYSKAIYCAPALLHNNNMMQKIIVRRFLKKVFVLKGFWRILLIGRVRCTRALYVVRAGSL